MLQEIVCFFRMSECPSNGNDELYARIDALARDFYKPAGIFLTVGRIHQELELLIKGDDAAEVTQARATAFSVAMRRLQERGLYLPQESSTFRTAYPGMPIVQPDGSYAIYREMLTLP